MGQKSRHKKDRNHRQQPARQESAPRVRTETVIPSLSGAPVSGAASAAQAVKPNRPLNFGEQTEYVRPDIIRIVILLAVMASLLICAAIVNKETTLLRTAGSHLATFMGL